MMVDSDVVILACYYYARINIGAGENERKLKTKATEATFEHVLLRGVQGLLDFSGCDSTGTFLALVKQNGWI